MFKLFPIALIGAVAAAQTQIDLRTQTRNVDAPAGKQDNKNNYGCYYDYQAANPEETTHIHLLVSHRDSDKVQAKLLLFPGRDSAGRFPLAH